MGPAGAGAPAAVPAQAGVAPPAAAAFRLAVQRRHAHPTDVNCVRWHPHDAKLLASAGDDGTVRLWRLRLRQHGAEPARIGDASGEPSATLGAQPPAEAARADGVGLQLTAGAAAPSGGEEVMGAAEPPD